MLHPWVYSEVRFYTAACMPHLPTRDKPIHPRNCLPSKTGRVAAPEADVHTARHDGTRLEF